MKKDGVYYVIGKDSKDAINPLEGFCEIKSVSKKNKVYAWDGCSQTDYIIMANIEASCPGRLEWTYLGDL
jgi:hypothetical protein